MSDNESTTSASPEDVNVKIPKRTYEKVTATPVIRVGSDTGMSVADNVNIFARNNHGANGDILCAKKISEMLQKATELNRPNPRYTLFKRDGGRAHLMTGKKYENPTNLCAFVIFPRFHKNKSVSLERFFITKKDYRQLSFAEKRRSLVYIYYKDNFHLMNPGIYAPTDIQGNIERDAPIIDMINTLPPRS